MIRLCNNLDFDSIWAIVNDGARAYKGIIPDDCWTEPYMPNEGIRHEIDDGVVFRGAEEEGVLEGVMGIQHVHHAIQDVTLIRHAYVRTGNQNKGIGTRLLQHLLTLTQRPVLVGTWSDAIWAIRFYEKHGFRLVGPDQKDRLLRRYWTIPERQIETPSVLADSRWWEKTEMSRLTSGG
jgi:GNAT superfamily N-acetyltransferase